MAEKKSCKIKLDREICKACYLCISVCPKKLIGISNTLNQKGYYPAEFNEDEQVKDHKCTGCATCALICPDIAIEVERE